MSTETTAPAASEPARPALRWQGREKNQPTAAWLEAPGPQAIRIHALLQDLAASLWGLPTDTPIDVSFLAEGSWNRVFRVRLPDHGPFDVAPMCRFLVFRIALPVLPWRKVRSEVATMRWVRETVHTASGPIPVPRVFLYDPAPCNAVGYEWILMEQMPGQPYKQASGSLSLESKKALARTIADWVHAFTERRFDSIGSLYDPHDCPHAVDGAGAASLGTASAAGPRLPQHPSIVQVMALYPARDSNADNARPPGPYSSEARSQPQGQHESATARPPQLGPLCSPFYTGDWRPEYDFSHGPFGDLASYCLSFACASRHEIHDSRQRERSRLCHLDMAISLERRSLERAIKQGRPAAHLVDELASVVDMEAEHSARLHELHDHPMARPSANGEATTSTSSSPSPCPPPAPPDLLARVGFRRDGHAMSTLVATGASPYDWTRWTAHEEAADRLVRLILEAVPSTPLPPRSTFLAHWDISHSNVLLDPTTGTPTALLDWEQMYTRPVLAQVVGGRQHGTTTPPRHANNGLPTPPTSPADAEAAATAHPCFTLPIPPVLRHTVDGDSLFSYLSERPADDDAGMVEEWELQAMQGAYWRRLHELAAAPTATHEENQRGRPGLEKPRKENTLVGRIVDLVDNYWISPGRITALAAEHEGQM